MTEKITYASQLIACILALLDKFWGRHESVQVCKLTWLLTHSKALVSLHTRRPQQLPSSYG